ncbi:hypothetical protein FOPE_05508 [Fonsecaea pedrosoi]|nr:hypothetical protein FOPE_05508 [Fonsecaea pedrosoi]
MASTAGKLNLPKSTVAVEVSVIDTTTYIRNVPGKIFFNPIYPGLKAIAIPDFSILIHHKPTGQRLLYDLGLRTNWASQLSPHLLKGLAPLNLEVDVKRDVGNIITDGGIQPSQINAIIYSHHHWDHTGDPTLFPASTKIVVGPGYKNKYFPGWPTDADASETTSDIYVGKEIVELDFQQGSKVLQIGPYSAFDWFGDGSFYLLSTPGHTGSHISGLARTTVGHGDDTFIFLGGDLIHHSSLLRPTKYLPLPEKVPESAAGGEKSTKVYSDLHRLSNGGPRKGAARESPFCLIPEDGHIDEDPKLAQKTVNEAFVFDGHENIFTVFAHDESLLGVIDFFPLRANDWKDKGWAEQSRWSFLDSLTPAK